MIGIKRTGKSVISGLRHCSEAVLDTVFPAYCLYCGSRTERGHKFLCKKCFQGLPRDIPESNYYGAVARLAGISPFTEYRSDLIFSHHNAARLLLHQIKYRNNPELAYQLARKFALEHKALGHFADISVIVPIPLSSGRLRERGYNQSEYIAKGLSEGLGVPVCSSVLSRYNAEGSQTSRSKKSRWEDLSGLFFLKDPVALAHKRVLICDDLLTSGSTLLHAGRTLLSSETPPESLSYYTLFLNFLP